MRDKEKAKIYNKEYRKNNSEKLKAFSKKYTQVHKKEKREYDRKYRQIDKEKKLEKKRNYYRTNKEIIAQKAKKYNQNNKEKLFEIHKEYRRNNKEKLAKRKKEDHQKHLNLWFNTPNTVLYDANKKVICEICGKRGIYNKQMALHHSCNCEIKEAPGTFLQRNSPTPENIEKFNRCHFTFLCNLSGQNCNIRLQFYEKSPLKYLIRLLKQATNYHHKSINTFLHMNREFIPTEYKKCNSRGYTDSWLHYKINLYGENPQCMICEKTLEYVNGKTNNRVSFDHTKDFFVRSGISGWLRARPPNKENYNTFKKCNFGILCNQCNRLVGNPKDRGEWLKKALIFCFKQKLNIEKQKG